MNRVQDVDTRPLPPWAKGSVTSYMAAAAKGESARETERLQVATYIKDRGWTGATRDEIGQVLGMAHQSVCPRVWELLGSAGRYRPLVRETDRRRITRRGRWAAVIVWAEKRYGRGV